MKQTDNKRHWRLKPLTSGSNCRKSDTGATAVLSGLAAKDSHLENIGDPAKSLVDLATPVQHVAAFCRAVMLSVLPSEIWGIGEVGESNKMFILRQVDHFVGLSRFESLSLHVVVQGLKVGTANPKNSPKS